MKKLIVGVAAAALIFSSAGCGTSRAAVPNASPHENQSPSEAATGGPTPSAVIAPTSSPAAVLAPSKSNVASTAGKILGTGTFRDGIAFEIRYRVVKASSQAVGAEDGKLVVLDLTVTNRSSAPIRVDSMGADIAYNLSAAVPPLAEQAVDPAAGINDVNVFDSAPLQPGSSQVLTNGYGLPTAAMSSVTAEVFGPDLDSDPVKVSGSLTGS
jgi:hypothetical protein